MALSIPGLAGELKTEIEALYGVADDSATLQKFCDAVSKAVISHIIANAVVTSVTSTPGAESGPNTLPGTATGTIT
jgi:hypothetical protein